MDNIEDIRINELMFRDIYRAFKREMKIIKVSFFFCGTCHKNPSFRNEEPFRAIPIFVMPKPDIKIAIQTAIKESYIYQRIRVNEEEEKKGK